MVLGAPVGYPIEISISLFLGLLFGNSFGTWEVSLVKVSLGALGGLMVGTVEGSLVGLSLVLALGSLIEYPNPRAVLTGTLLGTPLRFWFGSEAIRY